MHVDRFSEGSLVLSKSVLFSLVILIDTYDAAQNVDLRGEVDSQVLSPLSSTTCRTFHLYLRESHPV